MSIFTRIIEHEVKTRGISYRRLAREIGVTHPTISGIMKGRPMEVNTARAVCNWLGVPLGIMSDNPEEWKEALVIYAINSDSYLKKKWAELENVSLENILSPDDFRTLRSFLEFKVSQNTNRGRTKSP